MKRIGDRVGAVLSQERDMADGSITAYFLGYGVYEGERIPPAGVTMAGIDMHAVCMARGSGNPCILLDSGKRVFGCECWWGSETEVRKMLEESSRVVEVDIDVERAKGVDRNAG